MGNKWRIGLIGGVQRELIKSGLQVGDIGDIERLSVSIEGMCDVEISKMWDKDGISPTLDIMQGGYRQPLTVLNNLRIRKLTPKECYRLMGFDDCDFEKASIMCSNSQLYKQAGNSIVVNVLEAILQNLLKMGL